MVVVVGAAVLVAAMIRGPAAGMGMPYVHHPDEPHNVYVAQRSAAEGRFAPGEYNYPALIFDLQRAAMAVTDHEVVAPQTMGNSYALRPDLFVGLRWLVGVLPGLLAVAVAGAVAWIASRRWWAAGLAAGLMAFSPLELRFGPLVTPDAWAGAASGLAVLGAVGVALGVGGVTGGVAGGVADGAAGVAASRDRRRLGLYLLTGAAIGLAMSAKYNAALVAVPLVVAHFLSLRLDRPASPEQPPPAQQPRWSWLRRWHWLALAVVVAVAVFLLFNPFAVLDRQAFMGGIARESRHYRKGHAGSEGGSFGFHLSWLWRGFGPALLLAPLGVVAKDRRVRHASIVALSLVVAYVGFISSFEVRFARNLLPLTVALAGAAALGAVGLSERIEVPRRAAGVILTTCCIALLAWPASQSQSAFRALTNDHWASAEDWLDENVPPGSKVAVGDYGLYVEPGRYEVTAVPALVNHDVAWYRDQDFALIVAGEPSFHRFLADPGRYPQAAVYQALLDQTCLLHASGPPDAQVLLLSPEPCDS